MNEIGEYFTSNNIVKTELSIRRKRKRRKLEIILNIIKIPIVENHWKMKEEIIYRISGKEKNR
jgi:predicted transcriptional regulator